MKTCFRKRSPSSKRAPAIWDGRSPSPNPANGKTWATLSARLSAIPAATARPAIGAKSSPACAKTKSPPSRRPICSRSLCLRRRARWDSRRRLDRRNASGFRRDSAARTRAFWPSPPNTNARCRGALSACRATRTDGRGCGSLCKRESNTFAAKKRRATFARRRFCRRFCRSLSRFITAPAACAESRLAPPASPPRSRRGWSKWDTPRVTASASTLCASTASKPTLSRRGLGTIRASICCANRRRQSASASIN